MNLKPLVSLLPLLALAGCSGGTPTTITPSESKQIAGGPRPANVDVGSQIANSKARWQAQHPNATGGGQSPAPAPGK